MKKMSLKACGIGSGIERFFKFRMTVASLTKIKIRLYIAICFIISGIII